ncbi:hypothetical protein OFC58_31750, partial [Escherichia coli]|nr:hypothetical protein [Escherichia coli]
ELAPPARSVLRVRVIESDVITMPMTATRDGAIEAEKDDIFRAQTGGEQDRALARVKRPSGVCFEKV